MRRLSCLVSNLLASCDHVRSLPAPLASASVHHRHGLLLGGRSHEAVLPAPAVETEDAVGCWLADAAHAEAASVVAFKAVARELESHEAPESLPAQARAAAQDEVRHAALMESMAMRWGVQPKRPKLASIAVRSLEAMAIENAAEGCVRETWAALEACHQARWAKDPVIRRAMSEISADELRHAEFSWAVDAWARRRLCADARARVEVSKRKAVSALFDALAVERDRNLCVEAGMPSPAVAAELARGLSDALWMRPVARA